ncbi:protein MTSS 2 [Ciona intestinalis]
MDIEKECTLLGTLFQAIVTDLKGSSPAWEDFVNKGTKLHNLLKATTVAMSSFLDSIQKIADFTTNTKGSTKDIGSALTRICVRQKMMENKLKLFTNALLDNLVVPIQERLEEWKKVANQLEKDHAKDYKKAMHDIKKRNGETIRLQKKVRKGSKPDLHQQLNSAMHEVNDRFTSLEETEKSALRNLLVEERTRICLFANCLSPVLDMEVSMLNEVSNLHELTSDVARLCRNPKQLPTSTDQLVQDFIAVNSQAHPSSPLPDCGLTNGISFTPHGLSPPASPSSNDSRKSSMCSLNSINSSDSRSSGSLTHNSSFNHHRYQGYHRRTPSGSTGGHGSPTSCKSAPSGVAVARLSSVSSHDSGFVSAGNGNIMAAPLSLTPSSGLTSPPVTTKPPIGLNMDKVQRSDSLQDGVSPIIRSRPNSGHIADGPLTPGGQNKQIFSWKDWSKPGPYDLVSQSHATHTLPMDSRRSHSVLPSKPSGPPPISPKPSILSHRLSLGNPPAPHPPPLLHANSEPRFFGSHPPTPLSDGLKSPPIPPKDPSLYPTVKESDPPLPPPPTTDTPRFEATMTPLCEEALPPPPPELLADCPENHPILPMDPPEPRYVPNPMANNFYSTMTLGRKPSNQSLQYSSSSGYSSQNTTPACSEDTIASHETDYGGLEDSEETNNPQIRNIPDYERWSTLPRLRDNHHSNQPNGRSAPSHNRRPASTSGYPASPMVSTQINTPGTATIRRKPSSKFNSVKRSSNTPKPVLPPTVPSNAVSNLMSTFQQPSRDSLYRQNSTYNNNNNNNEGSAVDSMYSEQFDHSCVAKDLTLKFQSSDAQDGSLTPTQTPTDINCTPNGFHHDVTYFPGMQPIPGVTPLTSRD